MIELTEKDNILMMETKELWNIIQLLEPEEIKQEEKKLKQIKDGVFIKVPIIYIIKKWTEEHPENKRISIKGYGKHEITEYYDEIDERNKIMREIIIKYTKDTDPTKPRT